MSRRRRRVSRSRRRLPVVNCDGVSTNRKRIGVGFTLVSGKGIYGRESSANHR